MSTTEPHPSFNQTYLVPAYRLTAPTQATCSWSRARKMAVSLAVKLVILLLTATSICTQNEPQKDGILVDEYLEHAEKEGIITRVQAQQLKKLARDLGEIETLAKSIVYLLTK